MIYGLFLWGFKKYHKFSRQHPAICLLDLRCSELLKHGPLQRARCIPATLQLFTAVQGKVKMLSDQKISIYS